MALQLVYTSAPRLLQAGRTGFGTVAMHSGIPSWLQSEIEGFSQFSRLPGLDTSRVILCHTILGQGDRKHHVFSRIQDCGADYTGRTNHIAHHFIFTASEIIQATKLGLTPVDVLAHLNHGLWKTTWSGDASILDSEDELAIISIPKNTLTLPALAYWGHLCPEHPEYAAILAPSKLSEACWLVYPTDWSEPIIYALGESLLLHTNPWAVTFTNNLQPTDNEQLFAWRCIPSDSPLLEKATSSVRPCIDLSDPSPFLTGIPHDLLEQARTGKKPLPKPRAIGKAVPPPSDFSANQSSEQETAIPAPSLNRASGPITQITRPNVGLSSLKRKSHKQKKPVFLIAAISIVFVLILGGIVIDYRIKDEFKKKQKETCTEWKKLVPNTTLEDVQNKLTELECKNLIDFKNKFSSLEIDKIHETIDFINNTSTGDNQNQICTEMRQFVIAYIVNQREKKYVELAQRFSKADKADINEFQKILDIKQSKDLYHPDSQEEKQKWDNVIALLKYLNDVGEIHAELKLDSLPSGDNQAESKNLLAQYNKKKAPHKVDTTPSGPVVETRDQTLASQPAESIQTTPASQLTTDPVNPPIYVFLEKPDDYKDLKPSANKFKELTTDNISPLTIDADIKNVIPTTPFSQFPTPPPDYFAFAVLDNNNIVEHIVFTHNKTFSKLIENPKKTVYNIEGNVFKFDKKFLDTLKQLKNGAKFLEKKEDLNFTFKWELKVNTPELKNLDLLNFLNSLKSNGTISSENPPKIEGGTIENEEGIYKGEIEEAKREIVAKANKFEYTIDDKSISIDDKSPFDSFKKALINDKKTKKDVFFKKIQTSLENDLNSKEKILNLGQELKKRGKLEGLDDFDDLKDCTKEIDSIRDTKVKEPLNTQFKKLLDNDSIEDLEKKYKSPSEKDLKDAFEKHFNSYKDKKTKYDVLENLTKNASIPIILTISIDDMPQIPLIINNFPITPSKPPGGQQ